MLEFGRLLLCSSRACQRAPSGQTRFRAGRASSNSEHTAKRKSNATHISRDRLGAAVFLRELARRGLGVVGLPVFVAEPLVRAGELAPVLTRGAAPSKATPYLVSPSQRKVSPRVAAFRAHVIEGMTIRR
jgi:DNA-binding transcriptional LysR family regulator